MFTRTILIICICTHFFAAHAQNAGDVVITEMMPNPAGTDITAEWLELYNTTNADIDIKGWLLTDLKLDSVVLSPSKSLIIKAKSYLVLGLNSDNNTNGGVTIDYQYAGFAMANTSDVVEIQSATGAVIDHVEYNNPVPSYALNLDPGNYDHLKNDTAYYWCLATQLYNSNDYGTPGQVNSSCNLSNTSEFNLELPKVLLKETFIEIHQEGKDGELYGLVDMSGRCIVIQQAKPGTIQKISTDQIQTGVYILKLPHNPAMTVFIR